MWRFNKREVQHCGAPANHFCRGKAIWILLLGLFVHAYAYVRACMWVPVHVGVRISACGLANPGRNAYAPYCDVICGLWLHHIFRHYLINGTTFGKKSYWIDIVKNVETFSCNVSLYYCRILVKFEISRQIFEKSANIKFRQNPSNGSRVVPCGQTDRQTDMTKLIVAFLNFANASKKNRWKILYISKLYNLYDKIYFQTRRSFNFPTHM